MKSRIPVVALAIVTSLLLTLVGVVPANAGNVSGSVSGHVYGPDGVTPVAGAGLTIGPWTATTDSTGSYFIDIEGGDASLTLPLFAQGYQTQGLAGTYYPGTPYLDQAQQIDLNADSTGIDFTLRPEAVIKGTVHYDTSSTSNFLVTAFQWNPITLTWLSWSYGSASKPAGTFEIRNLAAGDYLLKFYESPQDYQRPPQYTDEYFDDVIHEFDAQLITVAEGDVVEGIEATLDPYLPEAYRIAGADRFETAAGISTFWESADVVFIANGLNFPDALSAAPVAGLMGGPLLLTAPTSLPASTRERLVDLQPSTIVVVGGPIGVSEDVLNELRSYAGEVVRVAGSDRFDTSRNLAEFGFSDGARVAYLATGRTFPDALAAGPVAAHMGGPVVLVDGAAQTLDAATLALLDELGVTEVRIAGGESAVSAGIESQLIGLYEYRNVSRWWGSDRFETAINLNAPFEYSYAAPFPREFFVATGSNFPDALAAAAAAAYLGVPLFTSRFECIDNRIPMFATQWRTESVFGVGGPAILSDYAISLGSCT